VSTVIEHDEKTSKSLIPMQGEGKVDHWYCACQNDRMPSIAYCGQRTFAKEGHTECDHDTCGVCDEMIHFACPICEGTGVPIE
jgi:hypothetical protein